MGVNTWFRKFHENIYINQSIVDKIQCRYKAITRRINLEYWDSYSELKHSFYSGSYGKGTEVKTSDIDIVVELPYSV